MKPFNKEDIVRHPKLKTGNVIADMGETVIVRFGQKIEECAKEDLTRCLSLTKRMEKNQWDVPLEVVNRVQAEAICSINDTWGVFTRSRIELFPHQLWVCRQVNKEWPARWLVADDVGLGKTIEAGLILTPLLARAKVHRLLIMCPASLVSQWQVRMRQMFDIRAAKYASQSDTEDSAFWETHNQVVASLHTLRLDSNGRHQRLLESDPWDLVIVDEGHHLNSEQNQSPTLGYQLVQRLAEKGRIQSMLFFTGTPHRGKDYGFISLLELLRPDLFSNKRTLTEQLPYLNSVMIRNNKYTVTDLHGKRLFKEPVVGSETYSFTENERHFYGMLSEFIIEGKAYASNLSNTMGNAVMLVLISMQKLASSSVAAIRRAIRGRLGRIRQDISGLQDYQEALKKYQELEESESNIGVAQDKLSAMEENMAVISSRLSLVENEEAALEELLEAAESISEETKISTILDVLENRFKGRSVLFFTEYKATQSLLMSALIKKFGDECVTFINGDERADEVVLCNGKIDSMTKSKKTAAKEFNSGKVRFLVSTEAGGEGIDLHGHCHTLVHVDMPWNPMRMHQRLGRLVRIGQKRRADVLILRNPETVETRIWDKLNEKIDRINMAFREVMEEPEDVLQMVLGMESPSFFRNIFIEGAQKSPQNLSDWFDKKTASFGGKDAIETVRELIGNVKKFDFREVSDQIPRVDLPDLRPFMESSLVLNGRRFTVQDNGGFSFKTPNEWKNDPAIRSRYKNMIFDRKDRSPDAAKRMLGVGHKVVNKALEQAINRNSAIASFSKEFFPTPIVIFRIIDRVTEGSFKPDLIVGVKKHHVYDFEIIRDSELLKLLNELPFRRDFVKVNSTKPQQIKKVKDYLKATDNFLKTNLNSLKLDFRVPDIEILSILWSNQYDS